MIPSSSIIPQSFADPQGDPDGLFVGNFYEGQNKAEFSGGSYSTLNLVSQFFNTNASSTEGVTDITNGSFVEDPGVSLDMVIGDTGSRYRCSPLMIDINSQK